jgi:hypothetical protein
MRSEREAAVEPIRVKVYGLVARTRGRYLFESALALGFTAVLFVAWWLGWPLLRDRLEKHQAEGLPATVQVVRVVLEWAPWILLGALAIKLVEMVIVLRRFASKDLERPGTG